MDNQQVNHRRDDNLARVGGGEKKKSKPKDCSDVTVVRGRTTRWH
jgi:hypothetical protein